MSIATSLVSALLILAGLLLPGTIWARAARWPLPWLAGGVISALGLLAGVMALNAAGIRVTVVTLGLWQAALALAGLRVRRERAPLSPADPVAGGISDWWIALPALPMVLVTTWRAIAQPLPGADVDFRWNYLAEAMVRTGGLAHYPAFTAADFAHYFWPDGIAPLVASVYAWTYLAAGSTAKAWTALPMLLQFGGLLALLLALGRFWSGPRGGWFAVAFGGATMLLQFSLNLGQETGLTTLGVGGLAFYLAEWQRTRRSDLLGPAAASAALAASAREYGLIFPVVGAGWLLARRAGWRPAAGFAVGALVLPVAWHLRNWVRTGNPFYAQDVAGIFPVNPVFAEWMRGYVGIYGAPLREVAGWLEIGRLVLVTALPAWLGLLAGLAVWRREPGWGCVVGLALATLGCWLLSVPYTAGGLFYSMRVLGPLLLLGCAWGGAVLARWVPGRRYLAGVWIAGALWGTDAALRALTIPANPYQLAPREWFSAGYSMQRDFDRQNRPFLVAAAHAVSGRVLSETAAAQGIFREAAIEVTPVWSPELAFLFTPARTGEAAARLRALGYTHVLLTRVQSSVDFLTRTGVFGQLEGRLAPVMMNDTFILLALQPAPTAAGDAK
ncbi:MAG TPA: hypothetical protein VG734_18755 [Lacunisphaera sp.]|nr:hypothetical protein [Lacunisphaera sp.]